jgi:hypothetical protein
MKRSSAWPGIEPIGAVLRRERGIAPPPKAPGVPISARDWEAAVGSRIAARTRPTRLERGVLFVQTASATWAQELSLLAGPIVEQLRARGVEVESLRFRVGPVDAPARPPARDEVRTSPPAVPLPAPLKEEIARVPDESLREVIARAAAKNLGWQEMREGKTKPSAQAPARSARPAARGPRSAAPETDQPGPAEAKASAGRRGKRGSS